ncbi:unnamed protein product [Clonostachys solani]|uniref:Uncharacterized protein n=1 Tax=Clonostachys solani TaxID=160281 RepID=A0A9P0EP69_9HYPO|nr:unnamed protein product [Clonostachys solani]
MAPITFEDIPYDCLREVMEELMWEPGRSGLKSLSLTNHRLRAISMRYLNRCISLRLPCGILTFHHQIARRIWLLWRYDAFSSVRRVVAGTWDPKWDDRPEDMDEIMQFDLADLDPFYGSADKNVFQNGELQVEPDEDCATKILIELLDRLPGLKHFVFPDALPSALLQELELKHPKCRLRIYCLDNDSIMNMELITSPCLDSIGCVYSDASGADQPKCNLKSRVMAIIAGMAPSLRGVGLLNRRVDEPLFSSEEDENAHWESQGVPYAPHQMFTEQAFPRRLGQLKFLTLKGQCQYPIRLDKWANMTDFTVLESLRLEINFSGPDLDSLKVHGIFPRLRIMSLSLYCEDPGAVETEDEERLIKILSNLPPLQSLKLTGYIWPHIPAQALRVHGQSLERLALFPISSEDQYESGKLLDSNLRDCESLETAQILNILDQCPLLEELNIPVQRTYENADDPAIYEAMGELRRLRSVTLYMDCFAELFNRRETYEAPDLMSNYKHYYAITNMQEVLWTCAMDHYLAWEILKAITGGRTTHVLRELRLLSSANATEASTRYGDDMGAIIQNLATDHTFIKDADGMLWTGQEQWDTERIGTAYLWTDKTSRRGEA